jgi:hypothetical protein
MITLQRVLNSYLQLSTHQLKKTRNKNKLHILVSLEHLMDLLNMRGTLDPRREMLPTPKELTSKQTRGHKNE